jgi:hypothetical protein
MSISEGTTSGRSRSNAYSRLLRRSRSPQRQTPRATADDFAWSSTSHTRTSSSSESRPPNCPIAHLRFTRGLPSIVPTPSAFGQVAGHSNPIPNADSGPRPPPLIETPFTDTPFTCWNLSRVEHRGSLPNKTHIEEVIDTGVPPASGRRSSWGSGLHCEGSWWNRLSAIATHV